MASAARSMSSAASAGSRPAGAEQRLGELQHDPRGTQLGTAVVAERRAHDRAVGQLVAGPVVVGDHDVEPRGARRGDLLDRGDAAVDRDEQPRRAPRSRSTGDRRARSPRRSGSAAPDGSAPRARRVRSSIAVEQTPSTS